MSLKLDKCDTVLYPFEYLCLDQEDGQTLVSGLLDRLMKSDKYGERRGAAFGLAGVVKGFGISCLKQYGIATVLREGLEDRYATQLFPYFLSHVLVYHQCKCITSGLFFLIL